jgi:sulfopyruvate decarboxylase alpha subunit
MKGRMADAISAAGKPITLSPPLAWQVGLADALLDGGVTVAPFVPDSRLDGIMARFDERELPIRGLAREEECIAFACGHRLAGLRPVVLMQCSGIGNALNALASLAIPYGIGLPLVLSMRGTLGERNPSQVPMGRATPAVLDALGIQAFSLRRSSDVETVTKGVLSLAYEAQACAAILLEPELGGGLERG